MNVVLTVLLQQHSTNFYISETPFLKVVCDPIISWLLSAWGAIITRRCCRLLYYTHVQSSTVSVWTTNLCLVMMFHPIIHTSAMCRYTTFSTCVSVMNNAYHLIKSLARCPYNSIGLIIVFFRQIALCFLWYKMDAACCFFREMAHVPWHSASCDVLFGRKN